MPRTVKHVAPPGATAITPNAIDIAYDSDGARLIINLSGGHQTIYNNVPANIGYAVMGAPDPIAALAVLGVGLSVSNS